MVPCSRMLQRDTDKTFSPWRGSVLAEIDQGYRRSYRWRGLALVSAQVNALAPLSSSDVNSEK